MVVDDPDRESNHHDEVAVNLSFDDTDAENSEIRNSNIARTADPKDV